MPVSLLPLVLPLILSLLPVLAPRAVPFVGQDAELRLTAYVVGEPDAAGARAWARLLRDGGLEVRVVPPARCAPEALRSAHVVLVDWPSLPLGERAPLGPFERWDRPTLLLGRSGDAFAAHWGLPAAAEMASLAPLHPGPEMQRLDPPAPLAPVWRQGNLFHVAAAAPPDGPEARAWLLRTVREAARFVSDRPILRHAAPAGAPLPADEQQRRARVATHAEQLGIAPDDRAALVGLAGLVDGPRGAAAATLLADLVPEAELAEPSRANWSAWLRRHADALVWDPLSAVWRVDQLAYWRGIASAACRGDQRADGGVREPDAVALAAKAAQRHGSRALADLAAFSCRHGDLHFTWDRRRGLFRVENHHVLAPGVFATPWQLAVLDTAADRDLIRGGGPPPRPRVSARGSWRELVEQMFLPVMLLEPGVSLRRVPEHDRDGARAIGVRLAGRGADLRTEHLVLIQEDGTVTALGRIPPEGRVRWQRVEAVAPCGPLFLASELVEEGRRPRRTTFDDFRWNPDVAADLATAPQRLSEPRAK